MRIDAPEKRSAFLINALNVRLKPDMVKVLSRFQVPLFPASFLFGRAIKVLLEECLLLPKH
jgi:hypothetical protein